MSEAMTLLGQAPEQLHLAAPNVPGLTGLAEAPFLFRLLAMVALLGVVAGVIGVIVNLRSAEFSVEAMVHAVFPGVAADAVYWGIDAIIPAASVVAVTAAAVLIVVPYRSHRGEVSEVGTATVLTSSFSVRLILSLAKGDMSGQLGTLMLGRSLEITDERLAQALIVYAIALLLIAVTWKKQTVYASDRTGAYASGLGLLALDLVLNTVIAVVVVPASTAAGTLLITDYLVIPDVTARVLVSRACTMVPVAIAVGVGGGYLGMLLMTLPGISDKPISPQATVALAMTRILLIVVGVSTARERLCGPARRAGPAQPAAAVSISTTIDAPASAGPIGGSGGSGRGVIPMAKRSRV